MSTPHYKHIGLRDLLQNKTLSSVLPQFPKSMQLQNVYSYAKVEEMVAKYLTKLLGHSKYDGVGGILTKGSFDAVLQRVKNAVPMIETFFNSTPSVVKNIRRNTKLYLPYNTIGQIKGIKSTEDKLKLLQQILENITYNPEFNTTQTGYKQGTFLREQALWKKKVGYKEE